MLRCCGGLHQWPARNVTRSRVLKMISILSGLSSMSPGSISTLLESSRWPRFPVLPVACKLPYSNLIQLLIYPPDWDSFAGIRGLSYVLPITLYPMNQTPTEGLGGMWDGITSLQRYMWKTLCFLFVAPLSTQLRWMHRGRRSDPKAIESQTGGTLFASPHWRWNRGGVNPAAFLRITVSPTASIVFMMKSTILIRELWCN